LGEEVGRVEEDRWGEGSWWMSHDVGGGDRGSEEYDDNQERVGGEMWDMQISFFGEVLRWELDMWMKCWICEEVKM